MPAASALPPLLPPLTCVLHCSSGTSASQPERPQTLREMVAAQVRAARDAVTLARLRVTVHQNAVAAAENSLAAAQSQEAAARNQEAASLAYVALLEDQYAAYSEDMTHYAARHHARPFFAEGCLLVYLDIPVTGSMRQEAAAILAKYPSLTAGIMEGGSVHSHTAGQQPDTLGAPRLQAEAAVRMGEGSLTILATGPAPLPAASSLGHQQLELTVRLLLLEGYGTVALQLLMTPCQAGLWAGTVQLPPGCAGFRYVQLEAGNWAGDLLVTFSLRWACMALLQGQHMTWSSPAHSTGPWLLIPANLRKGNTAATDSGHTLAAGRCTKS